MTQQDQDTEKGGKKALISRLRQEGFLVEDGDDIQAHIAWAGKKILDANITGVDTALLRNLLSAWPTAKRIRPRAKDSVRWEWPEIRKELWKVVSEGPLQQQFNTFCDFVDRFYNSFDLCVKRQDFEWIFIEMKVSKTKCDSADILDGFFFGASPNELEFARKLGSRHLFCFARHAEDDTVDYKMIQFAELESRLAHWHNSIQITLGQSGIAEKNKTRFPWKDLGIWDAFLNRKSAAE